MKKSRSGVSSPPRDDYSRSVIAGHWFSGVSLLPTGCLSCFAVSRSLPGLDVAVVGRQLGGGVGDRGPRGDSWRRDTVDDAFRDSLRIFD